MTGVIALTCIVSCICYILVSLFKLVCEKQLYWRMHNDIYTKVSNTVNIVKDATLYITIACCVYMIVYLIWIFI